MSTTFGSLPDTLGNILESDMASQQSASMIAAEASTSLPHLGQAGLWATEFKIQTAPPLFPEQQAAFDSIMATQCGLVLLTGGPGSGKTHLTQRLAHALAAGGRSVLLSATTGAAAVNLSKSASIVHNNFVIPVTGFFRPLPMHSVKRLLLKESQIFIIDEMSMLTHATLTNVLNRLMQIHNVSSFPEVLRKVLIVLVVDHAQLPPVCQHVKTVTRARQQQVLAAAAHQQIDEAQNKEDEIPDMSLCQRCHLAFSPHWQDMTKYNLSCQPRFDDPGYAEFLNLMRSGQPTQDQVDEALSVLNGVTYITKEEARQMVGAHCRALCTHREDVTGYNHHAVLNSFTQAMQVPAALHSDAHDVPEMASWLADPKFHRFKHVAIGCRVALLDNIQVSRGAANGSTGTVTALEFFASPCHHQQQLSARRKTMVLTDMSAMSLDAGLCADRTQNPGTITDNVIIDVRSACAPGLLYVMLSRVKNRKQLFIVGRISASMCAPIQLPQHSMLGTTTGD
ncbi:hypothetical protein CEUSTIGMA_g2875.t1 [Chlamydomonas eustigma]|uniref:AAA+ ATPase domain-containing protein n=1 Tax=Chlamydomonas eustigma TaxID=1157962 RepID=A0A250WX90_9CHLO|nr:hypothetical protein CEUSTIGMA_g2875.t1 [Chlamydomonas eustigma]|eukprot:GAX75431.1 hypothetical protein CEUSTIGMA_g2875.t1 [Chlamydomonas eustigma]